MGREPILTDAIKKQIAEDLKAGRAVRDMADQYGVTPNAIYRYFPRKKIKRLRRS